MISIRSLKKDSYKNHENRSAVLTLFYLLQKVLLDRKNIT